jgi:hypothetical protein
VFDSLLEALEVGLSMPTYENNERHLVPSIWPISTCVGFPDTLQH